MLNVVILAAGQGKRMQSDLPKVLHPVAGRPMLAHTIDTARQLDPKRIVVVVGHEGDQVQAAFSDQPDLLFVTQNPQQGTGHAVQQALPHLSDDGPETATLVLYGDVPLVQIPTLQRLMAARQNGMAVLTETLTNPEGYGRILRNAQGNVTGIIEHKDASDQQRAITEVNTGILIAPTRQLEGWLARVGNSNTQGEYYLTDVVALAVADNVGVGAAQPDSPWETLGVNSRLQQAELERAWQLEQARRLMEGGVTLADPARIDVRGSLVCGRDVFIDVGCVFEGRVELADGVYVGPHCVVSDTTVGQRSRIEAFSHVDQAQIGDRARVGPYARLRPGARLGDRAQAGNFVEIKNSVLGVDSKANHLAYVGDATIGARVNIGAGTITCNYDGTNKYETVIDDDVFIGSDTQLIAPVRVGRGATIGAGTTLTSDAPEGRLTLSRTQQKTIFGWTRPRPKT